LFYVHGRTDIDCGSLDGVAHKGLRHDRSYQFILHVYLGYYVVVTGWEEIVTKVKSWNYPFLISYDHIHNVLPDPAKDINDFFTTN